LKNLDLKAYYQQLEMSNQGNMKIAIDLIIQEFKEPFADPRVARTPANPSISNEKLFYLLIDESKRTFKRGLIVTATVSNVLDTKVICRLENGLNATVTKDKILDPESQEKLKDVLGIGHIVTGRIEKILLDDGEKKFEVQLNCKQGDLQQHNKYLDDLAKSIGVDPSSVIEADKKNLNFATDLKPKM
jgi:transcriptional accessory protein Tex/SPT6